MRFQTRISFLTPLAAALAAVCLLPTAASAEEGDETIAREDRIAELERKVDVLVDELERTRTERAVPAGDLKSIHGMGPGASKVYELGQGLSIGGYAEGVYTAYVADKSRTDRNRFDMLRAVMYLGYKFTDNIIFNTEIEFEHATSERTISSGAGSVSVEFAQLDYLWRDDANGRVGLLLVPMGFVNEIHEPPFYFGTNRPEVERRIIPSTWRENGAGLFGSTMNEMLSYKAYTVTSFNSAGFSTSGLRGGRQKGNKSFAEDMAFVGSVDFSPLPETLIGGSLFIGNTGQNQPLFGPVHLPDSLTTLWEVHGQYRSHGLHVRALFTMAHVKDAAQLSFLLGPAGTGSLAAGQAVASDMMGAYGEIAYDVWQWLSPGSEKTLEPFYRYEYVDTQYSVPAGFTADGTQRNHIHTVGLSFKPIPNVVFKLDYRNRSAAQGQLADEVNMGFGLVF